MARIPGPLQRIVRRRKKRLHCQAPRALHISRIYIPDTYSGTMFFATSAQLPPKECRYIKLGVGSIHTTLNGVGKGLSLSYNFPLRQVYPRTPGNGRGNDLKCPIADPGKFPFAEDYDDQKIPTCKSNKIPTTALSIYAYRRLLFSIFGSNCVEIS